MSLKITNGNDTIFLRREYCVPLELEVNLLERTKEWVTIGDHLYYFIYPDVNHPKPSDTLYIEDKYFFKLYNIIQNKNFY